MVGTYYICILRQSKKVCIVQKNVFQKINHESNFSEDISNYFLSKITYQRFLI